MLLAKSLHFRTPTIFHFKTLSSVHKTNFPCFHGMLTSNTSFHTLCHSKILFNPSKGSSDAEKSSGTQQQQQELQEPLITSKYVLTVLYHLCENINNNIAIANRTYELSRDELRYLFRKEMEVIVPNITKADGYQPADVQNFIIADRQLKYKVISATMKRFGIEIPSYQLRDFKYVNDVVEWYVDKVSKDRPRQSLEIPENLKMFINVTERGRRSKVHQDAEKEQRKLKILNFKKKYGLLSPQEMKKNKKVLQQQDADETLTTADQSGETGNSTPKKSSNRATARKQ